MSPGGNATGYPERSGMTARQVFDLITGMLGFQSVVLAFFGVAFLIGAMELMADRTRREPDSVEKVLPLHARWLFAGLLAVFGLLLQVPFCYSLLKVVLTLAGRLR
jgi:hypothetical protein